MIEIKRHTLRDEIGATVALASPVVLTQVAHISLGFVDTIMVGRLGPDSLAGVALGSTAFFTTMLFGMGVMMAVGPMVSQAFGAGEDDPIGRSVRQGLWLGLVMALPGFVLLQNIEPFLMILGQSEENTAAAATYLQAISWSVFPFLGFVVLRSFAEGVSQPRVVTVIAFTGVGLNVLANYTLMFGNFGFPALGLEGTGWASSIVYWTMLLLLVAHVHFRKDWRRYRIFSRLGKPDPKYFKALFSIGWPIGASMGVEMSLFSLTVFMMGWLGTAQLAAHQVAIQCAAFTFMFPLGIGMASSIRVGQAVGRRDDRGAMLAGYTGMLLSTGVMVCAAVVFLTVPRTVVGLYLDLGEAVNAEVISIAVSLLAIAAVFQVFDGLQVSAMGALRGLKDTRIPMYLAMLSYWGLGLTAAFILGFGLDGGATGLWWGLVLGLASAATLLTFRFRALTRRGVRYASPEAKTT